MEIDWVKTFPSEYDAERKKFERLPQTIPWGTDADENLWMTIEWLLRENRVNEIRYCEDPIIYPMRDGWFKAEFEDGRFIHACFPKDLFKFRLQFEAAAMNFRMIEPSDVQAHFRAIDAARQKLWCAWKCFGGDGRREEPKVYTYDENATDADLDLFLAPKGWPRVWKNRCFRCQSDLPGALQAWVSMQYKLTDL